MMQAKIINLNRIDEKHSVKESVAKYLFFEKHGMVGGIYFGFVTLDLYPTSLTIE